MMTISTNRIVCFTPLAKGLNRESVIGFASAFLITGLWICSLGVLLVLDLDSLPWPLVIVAILFRTHLQTGLFILGHDAMHGSLIPNNPRWNHRIGRSALYLYALLSYEYCRAQHRLHHGYAGQARDPDFHHDQDTHPVQWYLHFMGRYLSAQQLSLLTCISCLSVLGLRYYNLISPLNAIIFWLLPLSLSSFQLFFFGTYLPHRGSGDHTSTEHQAHSLDTPALWSFLACYHFSYHWEHHEYPHLPWYRLPAARNRHI